MMTRKDYIVTSKILNEFYEYMPIGCEQIFDEMIHKFVVYFKSDNANFKEAAFWDACVNLEEK